MKELFHRTVARLKAPGLALSLVSYLVSFAFIALALVALFVDVGPLAYVAYALAALGLAYSVYITVRFAPRLKAQLAALLMKNKLIERLTVQYGFRTLFFAAFSFAFNLAFALFNGVLALFEGSLWYGALAAYYLLLTVMRGAMILLHRKAVERRSELLGFRTVGVLLSLMPLALSAVILEMVASDKGYAYGGIVIYAVAAYTFWKLTLSVINLVKARKNDRLTVRAVRCIGFGDAVVSILALQTAMFRSFAVEGFDPSLANALTGAAVCLLTLALGLTMIIYSLRLGAPRPSSAPSEDIQ